MINPMNPVLALDLDDWSNIATIAAGITTVALVIFGLVQLSIASAALQISRKSLEQTLQSLQIGSRSADAAQDAVREAARAADAAGAAVIEAKRSANAAQESVLESARARVDAISHRVITLIEQPSWPPYIDRINSSTYQNHNSKRLMEPEDTTIPESREFHFPEDQYGFLWYRVRGVLKNEGPGSAYIVLDGDARIIKGESKIFPGESLEIPPLTFSYDSPSFGYRGKSYILQSGRMALFEWAAGISMENLWERLKDEQPISDRLVVRARGHGEVSAWDSTEVEFGIPRLQEISGRQGSWKLSDPYMLGVTTHFVKRVHSGIEFLGQRPEDGLGHQASSGSYQG